MLTSSTGILSPEYIGSLGMHQEKPCCALNYQMYLIKK